MFLILYTNGASGGQTRRNLYLLLFLPVWGQQQHIKLRGHHQHFSDASEIVPVSGLVKSTVAEESPRTCVSSKGNEGK